MTGLPDIPIFPYNTFVFPFSLPLIIFGLMHQKFASSDCTNTLANL